MSPKQSIPGGPENQMSQVRPISEIRAEGDSQRVAGSSASLVPMIFRAVETIEKTTCIDELIQHIGDLLSEFLSLRHPKAWGSIWLWEWGTDDKGDGKEAKLLLVGRHIFGEGKKHRDPPKVRLKQGLIGWVAAQRKPINVLVKDLGEPLPDGQRVVDVYIPWEENDLVKAELAAPMIYQNRLVGVLDLENQEAERFLPEVEEIAHFLALHAAEAIHHQKLEELYDEILGETDLDQLSKTFVSTVGKFINSICACIYLWDVRSHRLRLAASTEEILDANGQELRPGQDCYQQPGCGFTRWSFDNKMWLIINDLAAFDEPRHPEHIRQRNEIYAQVWQQCGGKPLPTNTSPELASGPPGEDREFWQVPTKTGKVPQPVHSRNYRFASGSSNCLVTVPIIDSRGDKPALGVMLFSRREERSPYTDFVEQDVTLLQGIARHLAQTISRTQAEAARNLEVEFISQVVTMESGRWQDEIQYRLRERLAEIRNVLDVDLVTVRAVNRYEQLALVANDPPVEELCRLWGESKIRISNLAYMGKGGSGRAVDLREPIYIENHDHPYWKEVRADNSRRSPEDSAFIKHLCSGAAVPLLVGDKAVGALAAISSRDAVHRVRRTDGGWVSEQEGVQRDYIRLLDYHGSWLAPALITLQEIARREQQTSSLGTAIEVLADLVRDYRSQLDLFRYTTLVVATHHDGLAFHQAMVASCTNAEGGMKIQGLHNYAWGAISSQEQAKARRTRHSVEDDIKATMEDSKSSFPVIPEHLSRAIRERWGQFSFSGLTDLPPTPCVIVRKSESVAGDDASRYPRKVSQEVAEPQSALEKLLDEFCHYYGIEPGSEAWRRMRVGVVRLEGSGSQSLKDSTSQTEPTVSVMFVTNVGFRAKDNRDEPYVDDFARESLDALNSLGSILNLAEVVADRDNMTREIKRLREDLNNHAHHFIERAKTLSEQVYASIELGKITPELARLLSIAMKRNQAQLEVVRLTLAGEASLGERPGWEKIPVNKLIEDFAEEYRMRSQGKGIKFTTSFRPDEAPDHHVVGNLGQLWIVLECILNNAFKAVGHPDVSDKRVWLETIVDLSELSQPWPWIRFRVSDSGPSIPPESKAKLFHQMHSATGGLGIGLLQSGQIATAHRGKLCLLEAAECELPPGATKAFEFSLPIVS